MGRGGGKLQSENFLLLGVSGIYLYVVHQFCRFSFLGHACYGIFFVVCFGQDSARVLLVVGVSLFRGKV